jgi:choline kinase
MQSAEHPVKHAVISAAGLGSRLELNMPKCLVDIGSRKIIDYQLELLDDIEDVRIVIGFMEDAVIDHVLRIRDDALFVRNPDYQSTTNSYSLHLATKDLTAPFLTIDGDLLIEPESFKDFLARCDGSQSIVGVTEAKSEEAVFAHLDSDEHAVRAFSLNETSPYEWSGIAYLKNVAIEKNAGFVFREIDRYLPLPIQKIACHEVDTPEDLNNAINALGSYGY